MSEKLWFVHLQGESVGPLVTSQVAGMLKQGQVQFTEYGWTKGYAGWVRLCEIPEFSSDVPPYPEVPIPEDESDHDGVAAGSAEGSQGTRGRSKVVAALAHPAKSWPTYRKFERFPLKGSIQVSAMGSLPIINVSEGGVFVATEQAPPIGTSMEFRLSSHELGPPMDLEGVVIRHGIVDGSKGFAIEFKNLPPDYRQLLLAFIVRKNLTDS